MAEAFIAPSRRGANLLVCATMNTTAFTRRALLWPSSPSRPKCRRVGWRWPKLGYCKRPNCAKAHCRMAERSQHRHRCLRLQLPLAAKSAKLVAALHWVFSPCLQWESPRPRRTRRGLSIHGSSPTRNPAQFACVSRVLTRWVGLASDDVARFALRLRQQSHHNEPSLCLMALVEDVLADLELAHGLAPTGQSSRWQALTTWRSIGILIASR